MQTKIEMFKKHLEKMHAFNHAMGVMYYDFETVMPKNAAEGFAKTVGVMSEEMYKMQTDEAFKALVKELLAHPELLEMPASEPVEYSIKK